MTDIERCRSAIAGMFEVTGGCIFFDHLYKHPWLNRDFSRECIDKTIQELVADGNICMDKHCIRLIFGHPIIPIDAYYRLVGW